MIWFYLPPLQRIRRTCTSAEIGSTSVQIFSSPTSKSLLPTPLQAPRVSIGSCDLSEWSKSHGHEPWSKGERCQRHSPVQCWTVDWSAECQRIEMPFSHNQLPSNNSCCLTNSHRLAASTGPAQLIYSVVTGSSGLVTAGCQLTSCPRPRHSLRRHCCP